VPTEIYLADVARVAERLLDSYYPGSELYESIETAQEVQGLSVSVYAVTSLVRPGFAALAAVQLSLEAAAVAAEYVSLPGHSGGEVGHRMLYELASDPAILVAFDELDVESLFIKLKVLKKRGPRTLILATAALAAAGLAISGIGLPLIIVSGAAPAIDFIWSRSERRAESVRAAQLTEKLAALDADRRLEQASRDAERRELEAMRRDLAAIRDQSIEDRESLRRLQARLDALQTPAERIEGGLRAIQSDEASRPDRLQLSSVESRDLDEADVSIVLIEGRAA
jgi:hypothetical protein